MANIHENYDKLTDHQREVLDRAMEAATNFVKSFGIKFHGGDPIERAVDAFAAAILAADNEVDVCITGNPAVNGVCGDPECVCAPGDILAENPAIVRMAEKAGGTFRQVSRDPVDTEVLSDNESHDDDLSNIVADPHHENSPR